jgi:hypothetical protein
MYVYTHVYMNICIYEYIMEEKIEVVHIAPIQKGIDLYMYIHLCMY